MNYLSKAKFLLSGSCLVIGLSLPAISMAQQAPQDSQRVKDKKFDEVIVTARKKVERLQDVPLSITAFDSVEIEKAGITDVQDLALQTPGFSYREGFGRVSGDAASRPSIRGMSSILGVGNAAFFIDGVFVGGPVSGFDLENLERVEVVRGPQSALFGRGAFGGAINFISRRPGQEARGKVKGIIGEHGHEEVSGYYSFPISDTLAAEINGRYYDFGGDFVNEFNGKKEINAEQSKRVGGKLNFTPTDNFSAFLNVNYAEDEDGQRAYGLWNGGMNRLDGLSDDKTNCFRPVVDNPNYFFGTPLMETVSRGYYCGTIKDPKRYYADGGGVPGLERETFNSSLEMSLDFNNNWNITSTTGYTWYDSVSNFGAYEPGSPGFLEGRARTTFSQELRISSPVENRLRALVGGYFYSQKDGKGMTSDYDPNIGESPYDAGTLVESDSDSGVNNLAAFGSLDYDVTDKLTVGAELRWQEEEITLAGTNTVGKQQSTFSAVLPRASLTYLADPNLTVYATAAKGNKPGGFNNDYYALTVDREQADFWITQGRGTVDESEVWSYELGAKGRLTDNITYDAAVYYLDWSQQQLSASDAIMTSTGSQTTVAYIINAGKSRVQGFEADLGWDVTDNLSLRLGYAYSDAEFTDYIDENWRDLQDTNGWVTGSAHIDKIAAGLPTGVTVVPGSGTDTDGDGTIDHMDVIDSADPDGQVAGNELPQTPKHMINFGATYSHPITAELDAFIRTDYSYESKRFVQATNLAVIEGSHKINLRAGVSGDSWSLTFFAKNLGQDTTPEVVTRLLDFSAPPLFLPAQQRPVAPFPFGQFTESRYNWERDFRVTPTSRRQFGAEISYNF